MQPAPRVALHNRQRTVSLDAARLARAARAALSLCLDNPGPQRRALARLASVEVSLVSDRTIARLHARFLGTRVPTDVITFQDGDLVASAETARREAQARRSSAESELLLYVIHGMLHLNGHEDHSPAGRQRMRVVQGRIHRRCRSLLAAEAPLPPNPRLPRQSPRR